MTDRVIRNKLEGIRGMHTYNQYAHEHAHTHTNAEDWYLNSVGQWNVFIVNAIKIFAIINARLVAESVYSLNNLLEKKERFVSFFNALLTVSSLYVYIWSNTSVVLKSSSSEGCIKAVLIPFFLSSILFHNHIANQVISS